MTTSHTTEHLKRIIETQSKLALVGFDLQTFMDIVVDRMRVLTPATGAVVELVDGEQMVYKAASGSVAPFVGFRLNIANSLTGHCVRDNEVKISADTSCDPRVDAEACKRVGASSMVVVPLRQGNRTVGVLKVLSREVNAFTPDDVTTLQLMAGMLGGALGHQIEFEERKQLEADLLQRSDELETRNRQLVAVLAELEKKSAQLEQKNMQAQEATRLKSEFLANMSHEIRTPMNAIVGFTDILLRAKLDDKHREYLSCIRDAGRGLIALIGDILDFSKIEAGKMMIEIIDFSPVQVVEGTAQLLIAQCQSKGLTLHTFVDPELPPVVLGDPSRVRQILINLIGNAIKFSESGSVVVRVTREPANGRHHSVNARFTVTDNGVGMCDEEISKLFRPFVQADGSTTRRFGGTGLGLSICKRLVELMGGEIGVTSSKGEGSSFWFTLPFDCKLPRAGAPAVVSPTQSLLQGKRVLIVDDDPVAREIIGSYLSSWKMQHTAVETSGEALEILRNPAGSAPIDVVITDLVMPEMDGFDLANEIHNDSSIASAPMLIMVTAIDTSHGEEALEEGFNGYLRKPIKQSQLLDCLATVFDSTKERAPSSGGYPSVDTRVSGRFTAFRDRARSSGGYATIGEKSRSSGTFGSVDHKRAPKVFRQGLILLAEDHPANQMVAELQLNELGLSTHIVNNGLEALEALQSNEYQAVLMDCQMPEMDGFEAVRTIRKQEVLTGRHVPIIAMTANAMQGDREDCIAAGMDDYITKPVELEELRRVLEQWLPADEVAGESVPERCEPKPASPSLQAIDLMGLVGLFGNKSVKKLLKVFLADTERSLDAMRAAISQHDVINLRAVAHKIKGACATIRAGELCALGADLESEALSEDWDALQNRGLLVTSAFEKVKNECEEFLSVNAND